MTATRFSRILLILLMLSLAMPIAALAQSTPVASPTVEDGVYRDGQGRFSVPVPTNWTVIDRENMVVLTDPDGELEIGITVVPGDNPEAAADFGWTIYDSTIVRNDAPEKVELDPLPGTDAFILYTDDTGEESGTVAQTLVIQDDDQFFVVVLYGSLETADARQSQLDEIVGGFTITGTPAASPVAMEALPFADIEGDLDLYIADLLARLGVPGASVAVVGNGEVLFAKGYGVADLETGQPVSPDTMMMIGSTNKSMTSMMMASQIDDGLYAWDTPVQELYPEFALSDTEFSDVLTMRDTLCACTGVPRKDPEFLLNASELTPEEVIASLATFDLNAGLGETFQYSNQMYSAGGFIAAQSEFPDVGFLPAYVSSFQSRVLDPIGMTRTTLDPLVAVNDSDRATPYGAALYGDYVPLPLSYENTFTTIAPAGGAWSTANDMAAYLLTQMNDGLAPNGTQVVSGENLAETKEPQVAIDATTSYALGWILSSYSGQPVVSHDGSTLGFSSLISYLPESDLGIVVLTNGQGAALFTEGVRQRFHELLFGQEQSFDSLIEEQIAAGSQQITDIYAQLEDQPDATALQVFAGTYVSETLGQIELRLEGERLVMDTGEFVMRLEVVPDQELPAFVVIDAPFALTPIFATVSNDDISLTITLGTDEYTFTRINEGSATPVASPVP